MSKILSVRLNEREVQILDAILCSENCACENSGEWLRLLLHREFNKRHNLGVPHPREYQSAYRVNGRTTLPLKLSPPTNSRSGRGTRSAKRTNEARRSLRQTTRAKLK